MWPRPWSTWPRRRRASSPASSCPSTAAWGSDGRPLDRALAQDRRVVVTGLGVISPLGNDVDTFWRRLVAGESGVGEITRFDTSEYKVHIAAEVQGFDAEDYIDKRKVR